MTLTRPVRSALDAAAVVLLDAGCSGAEPIPAGAARAHYDQFGWT